MTLTQLGDIAIIVSFLAMTIFVCGYATLVPWYSSPIGRALMSCFLWIDGITWLAAARNIIGIEPDATIFLAFRFALWVTLPFMALQMLWSLLIRGQIRIRYREKERDDSHI